MILTSRIAKYDVILMQMAARHADRTTPNARRPIELQAVLPCEGMPRIWKEIMS